MNKLKTILTGFAIGAGMSVPGLSGGTLAILLGVYNKLLNSVSELFTDFRKNAPFLILFALGGAAGLAAAATLITSLLSTPAEAPLRFAFLGAAAGCIPPLLHETDALPLNPKKLALLLAGAAAAYSVTFIPSGIITAEGTTAYLLQFAGGIIVAAALVLPGISASQMMYVLDIYEPVMSALSDGRLIQLLPLAFGTLAGILLTAKLLIWLLQRFNGTYLVILGFMIYSLKEMIPPFHSQTELLIGFICASIGFALATLLTKKEHKHTQTAK